MFPLGDDDASCRTVPLVTYALIILNVRFSFTESVATGSAAYMAHVGGFVAGFVLSYIQGQGNSSRQLTG